MAKVDLEKLICSLFKQVDKTGYKLRMSNVIKALKEQGLEYKDGKLVEIEQKAADKKGMNLVEEEMTPFQKKVFCIIDTIIEKEQRLKQVCDELLRLAHVKIMQESAWSEKYIADVFEKVGLAEIAREQGYDALTEAIQSAMIELSKFTPQSQPSDEQMKAIEESLYHVTDDIETVLAGLYGDLKKLKEE